MLYTTCYMLYIVCNILYTLYSILYVIYVIYGITHEFCPIACCNRRPCRWSFPSSLLQLEVNRLGPTSGISPITCCKRRPCKWSFPNSRTKESPGLGHTQYLAAEKDPTKEDYKFDLPNSLLGKKALRMDFPQELAAKEDPADGPSPIACCKRRPCE